MASVEQLLNEAQYAFQRVSFGESRDNERNASRASSLCKKIIRLLTGPFRQILNSQQHQNMNVFVTRANAYIEERRKSNTDHI